jgi:DNA polymerase-3 subunit epsilon
MNVTYRRSFSMKHIRLDRPLVCFDLETTGPDVARDRIVQIALVRVDPDGARSVLESLVDPGMPIPPDATRVHGISDADVAGKPTLAELADRILAQLEGADLAGFNSVRFDAPLLAAELQRVGRPLELAGRRHIDAMRIFHLRERRDLSAAYRFYCGRTLEGAHAALTDATATLEIIEGQLARYADLPRDVDALHRVCNPDDGRFVDGERKFEWDRDGEACFAFGRFRGRKIREIASAERKYLGWITGADFSEEVRQIAAEGLAGRFPQRKP